MTKALRPLGAVARDGAGGHPTTEHERTWRAVLERATLREVLMGAQDNLTNVLAVVLGVAIGAGRADLVALAGLSAAVAESVSMGGVLYSSTRAEVGFDERRTAADGETPTPARGASLTPAASGLVTALAALLGGLIPLTPFTVLPLAEAVIATLAISITALFALGSITGRLSGHTWWRDGIRLLLVAGLAASAAAVIGNILHVA
jgi:VIT1/CCC1 family predicted Fe2+/Mn2+ transporter